MVDPDNMQTLHQRTEVAMMALKDMLSWLGHHSGQSPSTGASRDGHNENEALSPAVGESVMASASLSARDKVDKKPETLGSAPPTSSSSKATGVGGPFYVAIYDATNSTTDRRQAIHDACTERGIPFLFIEPICDDEDIIMANIREVIKYEYIV